MRRTAILLSILLGLALAAAIVWAQSPEPTAPKQDKPIIVANPPAQMLQMQGGSDAWQSIPITPAEPRSPSEITDADDSCSDAPTLTIPSSDIFNVDSLSEDDADPILSCMWGTPTRDQGYRTAWYQFTAPQNGQVLIYTLGSNYDTVLAAYHDVSTVISPTGNIDPCTDFNLYMDTAACSDDSNGFTSEVVVSVRRGETYYIEVADWEASNVNSSKTLQIVALMQPIDTLWEESPPLPAAGGLSRHATAVAGNDIYVIGGQINLGGPTVVNFFQRYETDTGNWVDPTDIEAPYYSNTTAAYVNGRIYLPSGYSGGSSYDMTHWVYDIAQSQWLIATSLPTTENFAWATAVATPPLGYYVVGGLNTTGDPTDAADVSNKLFFYNAADDAWFTQTAMNDARYAHTAALVDGKLCVVGGLKFEGVSQILLPDGECYNGTNWTMIAPMNYPRYQAGSAVGPDGKWYVFGGIGGDGNAVSETEVYDLDADTWTVMSVPYDLGGTDALPARVWPRGGVVGNTLWAIGGHSMPLQQPLITSEKLFLPTETQFIPVMFADYGEMTRPDDHFGEAHNTAFNVAQYRNFDTAADRYDAYTFYLYASAEVTVKLSQIPSGSDYNLGVYTDNKYQIGKGENPGNLDESLQLNLTAGRYYMLVERVLPTGDPNTANYRIIVEK